MLEDTTRQRILGILQTHMWGVAPPKNEGLKENKLGFSFYFKISRIQWFNTLNVRCNNKRKGSTKNFFGHNQNWGNNWKQSGVFQQKINNFCIPFANQILALDCVLPGEFEFSKWWVVQRWSKHWVSEPRENKGTECEFCQQKCGV